MVVPGLEQAQNLIPRNGSNRTDLVEVILILLEVPVPRPLQTPVQPQNPVLANPSAVKLCPRHNHALRQPTYFAAAKSFSQRAKLARTAFNLLIRLSVSLF